ncbi:MAG TPA: 3-hydroxyacyl-CoA dehydrogenase family protein, partial [Vicinamibacteria bacterium]|nr:3-hydroxyacyl-CoA dehydrogenase family protein [Vicinamibacteria bacterium]
KRQEATRPKHLRYSTIPDRICELGRFGQKTGAGFYRYEKGSRTPIPDPEIAALVEGVSRELGIRRRSFSADEIVERCLYALINEGAKILEEGIALRASDIDLVWIHGYGFPRYRGGPMFFADTVGLRKVHEAVTRFHREQGEWMRPAPLLERLAQENGTFQATASA